MPGDGRNASALAAEGQKGYRYRHHHETIVSASIEDAFAFLADPASVPLLEPPWTDTRLILGPPRDFGLGSEREYVFRWSGIPVYLRIRVTELETPHRVVFEQAQGPWQSYHRAFTLRGVSKGIEIAERAEFRGMPGLVDHAIHRFVVVRQLRAIAAFRHDALLRHLGGRDPAEESTGG